MFSEQLYLLENPDVKSAVDRGLFKSGYDHYLRYGQREIASGQRAALGSKYMAQNADVARAVQSGMFKSAVDHYIRFGANEIASGKRAAIGSAQAAPSVQQASQPASPAQQFIDSVGKYLQVQKSPQEILPENQFKDPLRATLNESIRTTVRPDYEFYQLTPFQQQSANAAAANDMGMSGKFTPLYTRQLGSLERGYQDKVDAMKQQYENMFEDQYQRKLKDIANSPTSNVNI